jgi:hypothetical protein
MSSFRTPTQLNKTKMLRVRPRIAPPHQLRPVAARRFKSTNDVPEKAAAVDTPKKAPVERSFKGQLYDSTYQRLQREKAEQLRVEELRAGQPQRLATRLVPIIAGMAHSILLWANNNADHDPL